MEAPCAFTNSSNLSGMNSTSGKAEAVSSEYEGGFRHESAWRSEASSMRLCSRLWFPRPCRASTDSRRRPAEGCEARGVSGMSIVDVVIRSPWRPWRTRPGLAPRCMLGRHSLQKVKVQACRRAQRSATVWCFGSGQSHGCGCSR